MTLDAYALVCFFAAPSIALAALFLAAMVILLEVRLDATNAEARRLREEHAGCPAELASGCADLGQCGRLLTDHRYQQARSGDRS